ncbi:MAG: hypothetical protein AAFQ43_05775 [Bacteroidota bacterium]
MVEPFPDQGAIPFQRRRDAGGVVNAVIAFMRHNARELFVGYLALVAPFTIVSSLSLVLMMNRFGDVMTDIDGFLDNPDLIIEVFGPSYALLIVSQGLAFAFSQGAVAGFVRLYREGEAGAISPSVLWSETRRVILPVIGMYVLLIAGGIPLFIFGAVLIGALGLFGALLWFGAMCALMPIVHVWFASRMTESSNVLEAAGRAIDLVVRGEWLRSFGAIFLTWVVVLGGWFLLSIVVQMVVSLIGINSTSEDPAALIRMMTVWLVPVQILGSIIYIPPAIAAFVLHGSLVEDLDGPSVDDELDLLERGVDVAPTPGWDTPEAPRTEPEPAYGERAPTPPPPSPPPSSGGFRGGGFS